MLMPVGQGIEFSGTPGKLLSIKSFHIPWVFLETSRLLFSTHVEQIINASISWLPTHAAPRENSFCGSSFLFSKQIPHWLAPSPGVMFLA